MERAGHLASTDASGIERSCTGPFVEGLRILRSSFGVERVEARFHGNGFSPHRHDTYALGVTLHGIQTFRYRGSERFSRPGNVIVLHPDEVHDGGAGDEDGLIYRMIYLPPDLIRSACGQSRALPFVADPVLSDTGLWHVLVEILDDFDDEPGDLRFDDVVMRLAAGLSRHAGVGEAVGPTAQFAVRMARDFLESHCNEAVRSETLEAITGLDRYELARQFRRMLGTSPHRFLVMRRLEWAKRSLAKGGSLADAAAEAGFADQAHFTRHFRKAVGMTPGRWVSMQTHAR